MGAARAEPQTSRKRQAPALQCLNQMKRRAIEALHGFTGCVTVVHAPQENNAAKSGGPCQ